MEVGVDQILSLCMSIYHLAENVKANKERCQRVAKRVKALEELVLTIRQRGLHQFSAPVSNALKELYMSLAAAKALITKFMGTKTVMKILKSSVNEDKFAKINERLDDNFQILNGALQIEQGDKVNRIYDTLSRRSGLEQTDIGFGNQARLMSQDSVDSPTASPTSPMPLMSPSTYVPMITPATPVTSPTAAMPFRSVMPPMSPSTIIAMPSPGIMPVNNPTIPVNFSRPIAPSLFAPTVTSQTYMNTIVIPPKPVIHTIAPMTMQPVHTVTQMYTTNSPQLSFSQTNQSVVTTYTVNRPY